jgi:3-methyl-2-oxobutanoate hydroxymethyltransferase
MLTCYDFTTARILEQAGVKILLVGDSAANVILGHDSTVAVELDLLITLTHAVRRGAPGVYLMGDMPFGSYHGSEGDAVEAVCRMVRETGCDAVKLEVTPRQAELVARLADAGVAVCAHLGLRPQSVQRHGYRAQARTPAGIEQLVAEARRFESSGAELILLEAVPPQASRAVVEGVSIPVIGCGAGPAPMAHVVVLQDLLGQSGHRPRFVPELPPLPLGEAARQWVEQVSNRNYPADAHCYSMNRSD